jgi:hypothetical protein
MPKTDSARKGNVIAENLDIEFLRIQDLAALARELIWNDTGPLDLAAKSRMETLLHAIDMTATAGRAEARMYLETDREKSHG